MNDRFAAKLSLNAFYAMQRDWKGRKDEGFCHGWLLCGYSIGKLVGKSWSSGKMVGGPVGMVVWYCRQMLVQFQLFRLIVEFPEPFNTKWLSWVGPWSFHSFIGQMENERDSSIDYPNHYLWGMRGEIKPTILNGLEVGFFRTLQLGGDGRDVRFKSFIDAFLSQDNYGANTGRTDRSKEPGNQLAGIDLRWKVLDAPIALYGQVVGEDEDNFLPNCLAFQYGLEAWKNFGRSSMRLFAEYADLTSYWWTGDPRLVILLMVITYMERVIDIGGRPVGHWADQDSQIVSIGGLLQRADGIGWGATVRTGELNAGPFA